MANLIQKIECERRMRKLLEDEGMPQPNGVEYGYTCVRFFFDDAKACVVVDIDNPAEEPEYQPGDLERAEREASGDDDDVGYLETFGDPLSDDTSRN